MSAMSAYQLYCRCVDHLCGTSSERIAEEEFQEQWRKLEPEEQSQLLESLHSMLSRSPDGVQEAMESMRYPCPSLDVIHRLNSFSVPLPKEGR